MNNFFRAIIAGYGAKKLGGGCFGTILVFVLIWVALGQCSFSSRAVPPPETYPADRRAHMPIEKEAMDLSVCFSARADVQYTLPMASTGTSLTLTRGPGRSEFFVIPLPAA